jgi:hypothetical protein
MPKLVKYAAIQEAFETNPEEFKQAVYDATDNAAASASADLYDLATISAGLLRDWNEALDALRKDDLNPNVMSSPRNAIAARLQSILSLHANEVSTPGRYEVQFDSHDLAGWIKLEWRRLFRPDLHPWVFPSPAPEIISDQAVVALFADWGTGLYGAPVISRSIEALPRCDVSLHLGDTYYSGAPDEIATRLIADWPKRAGTVNRTLNGNHDMYSGGQGYFDALETFFKQSASCFAMQNANWILVCLDTAYKDADLFGSQVAWLTSIVQAAGTRKLILFSHYQPFSYFESQGPKLQKALSNLLNTQRIHAWFWGHEHRLVLYEPHSRWGFKGRCIGNGGFPNFRDKLDTSPSASYEFVNLKQQALEVPAAKVLDGPNPWITEDPQKYSPHGFVLLEFDGPNAFETYKLADSVAVTARTAL